MAMAWLLNSKTLAFSFGVILVAYLGSRYLKPSTPRAKSPVVTTSLGRVQGIVSTSRTGREYYEYLGIPYAAPPVGKYRWAPPQLPERWTDIRDASKHTPVCIQNPAYIGKLQGEEDCLYLNIYTPKHGVRLGDGAKPLPVMVWIHGGHFEEGRVDMYRPTYFMDEEVVLVTMAYRLNSFGFLNTGDEVVRGNMGLKDQTMALIWIQENIAAFGGDSMGVTIFGESAGGSSVHFQLISPIAQGLFQKAISQSGTALNAWALTRNPVEQAKRLARQLNCPTDGTTAEMVACMREVPAVEIARVHDEMKDTLRDPNAMFLPSVEAIDDDQAFLTQHPRQIMDAGQDGKGIPWLVGVNSEEGSLFWKKAMRNPETKAKLCDKDFWDERILDLIMVPNGEKARVQVPAIRSHHFPGLKHSDYVCDWKGHTAQYTKLYSVPAFFVALDATARAHARHSPTFAYYFDYAGAGSLIDIMDISGDNFIELEFIYLYVKARFLTWLGYGPERTGAAHGDELHYFWESFPLPAGDDTEISKALVKMWVQFARDENRVRLLGQKLEPIKPTVAKNVSQPLPVLEISMKPKYIPFPHAADVQFWNSLRILK